MLAEGIDTGIFMLVAYTAEEFNKASDFTKKIQGLNLPYSISVIIIDSSLDKTSASRL
ncbi:hypothetical protein SDC9_192578 [bioreactor metagenome]|uniref:Uncharacterized protein n=1 Tax=bioreactor metagenome TaxID=1076179 RepID=A0A645I149_9ZZZZ